MRLIDADKAREEAAIDLVVHHLDRQPTVDAVPVVRCCECKHHSEIPNTDLYLCHKLYAKCKADDFCSGGERKTDGQQSDS